MCPSQPKTPKILDHPATSVSAKDIVVREEHNTYPALFNVNANGDEHDESEFPHFT